MKPSGCDQRMILRSARLKNCLKFKWPGFCDDLPVLMRFQDLGDGGKIRDMIGPKIQTGVLFGSFCDAIEKSGLKQAIFVMPAFRPRVRKQHKDRGN